MFLTAPFVITLMSAGLLPLGVVMHCVEHPEVPMANPWWLAIFFIWIIVGGIYFVKMEV